jgi:hypothetical protein
MFTDGTYIPTEIAIFKLSLREIFGGVPGFTYRSKLQDTTKVRALDAVGYFCVCAD